MLQRLRVRTAEFPLKVHEVNVAVPPAIDITPPCKRAALQSRTLTIAYASCSQNRHPEAIMTCIP
jgi:hypothetical protein